MKLTRFRIRKFRNILDTGDVEVEGDVTCLVGMNEAGKSAVLTALSRLNPIGGGDFAIQRDYPRWMLTKDKRAGVVDETVVIDASFVLDAADLKAVSDVLGEGVMGSDATVRVSRSYGVKGNSWWLNVDSARAVRELLDAADLPKDLDTELRSASDFPALISAVDNLDVDDDLETLVEKLRAALELINLGKPETRTLDIAARILRPRLPKFFYFSNYSILDGRIDLNALDIDDDEDAASTPEQTARSLLRLAETTPAELAGSDYESRKAELEAVGNDLTEQVFTYWKQNPNLRVRFDVDRVSFDNPSHGQPPIIKSFLEIRVEDMRHAFTNNFSQRSSGFQWFFSFLAAFTEFETRSTQGDYVVLLDEPGLTLHGRAQSDFLNFINERLAAAAQVIYTTHSPFMVETSKVERVRIVEDGGPAVGATVSKEVLRVNDDSLFPLQAALGYDVVQHLFIGEANLLVEGPADYVFLDILSRRLDSLGRTHLDPDWRIMPAGGANNIPGFVALVGTTMEVSVLIDGGTEGAQRLTRAIEAGRLKSKRVIEVSEITGIKASDIEDLFAVEDYLKLYNRAFGKRASSSSIGKGDRVIARINAKVGGKFDHYKPAEVLLRSQVELLPALDEKTLDNFEALFRRINDSRR